MKYLFFILLLTACGHPTSVTYLPTSATPCIHLHPHGSTGPDVWVFCGPTVTCEELRRDSSGVLTHCHLNGAYGDHDGE